MQASELRELADKLVDPSDTLFKFHMDQAAAYLRACADALDAGPVAWTWPNGELLSDDQTDPMWKTGDAVALYPVAMPAQAPALRLPEPMTKAELLAIRMKACASPEAEMTNWPALACRAVESETLRRVKETNE